VERAPDVFETRLLDGKSLNAANDPVMKGTRRATGSDPFENRRTRVRSLHRQLSRERKETTD